VATKRITAAVLDAILPGETVWDTEVRGFGVRFRARDRVYLVKTRIKGQQRILTIGRHGKGAWGPESARREAVRLLGLIRDGKDVATERDEAKAAPTLAALAVRYMAEHAVPHHKRRTTEEEARLLKLHILPALGDRKVRDLGKSDVARFHGRCAQRPWPRTGRWPCFRQCLVGRRRWASGRTGPTPAAMSNGTRRRRGSGC
jgi:hypothetical protein